MERRGGWGRGKGRGGGGGGGGGREVVGKTGVREDS